MESLKPCHYEASNISMTSEGSPTRRAKYEDEEEEEESSTRRETKSRVVIDLEKENPNPNLLELNLFNAAKPTTTSKSKTFTCSFCGREFSTSQALGGHQNAHKQERALVKHRHKMVDMTAAGRAAPPPYGHRGYSYYFSPVPHQLPLYRSHGVRAESMIQKPNSYHSPSSYGGYGLSRAYSLVTPSSSSTTLDDGLKMVNFPSRELGIDKFNASLCLGSNPNPNPNPTTIDINACNAATVKAEKGGDSIHQRLIFRDGDDGNDQHDASGLDLELKL